MNTLISEAKALYSQRKAFFCILMAFTLILSSVSLGFVANAGTSSSFELVVTNDEAKIYAKDCVGMASGDVIITYDSDVIDSVRVVSGSDAKQVNRDNFETNSFTSESNPNNAGSIYYAFYFLDYLWEQDKFTEEDLSGECDINSEYFHLATIKFTLKDGQTPNFANFSITAGARINSESIDNMSCTVINNIDYDEFTTEIDTSYEEELPSEEYPTYEEITTERIPDDLPGTDGPESLEPQFLLELSGTQARLYIINCVGLYSGDMSFSYDPSIISRVRMTKGDAAKQVNPDNFINNSFTSDQNTTVAGEISYGFYFKDCLWSSEKFRQEDLSGECDINGEYFHLATLDLTLQDGATADEVDIDFSASIGTDFGSFSDFKCVFINYNEPYTEEPTTNGGAATDGPESLPPRYELVIKGDKVDLYARNCIGSKADNIIITYDTSVLSADFPLNCYGDDAGTLYAEDELILAVNDKNPGEVKFAYAFRDHIMSSEDFAKNLDVDVNGEYFHFLTFNISLADGKTYDDVNFTLSGGYPFEIINLNSSADEETTITPEEPTTDVEEPSGHVHTFEWEVTKKATSFEEGIETGTCRFCGDKETRAIEKLPVIDVKPEAEEEIKISAKEDIFVLCETEVEDLLMNIPENTEVVDKDGKAVAKDAPIATGMTVVLKDKAGNTVDTKTIVVPGDVNCDGSITATDARSTLRRAVDLERLEEYQESAANLESEKEISAKDARLILRTSVDLEDIKKLFNDAK